MCLDLSFNHQLLVNGFKLDGNKKLQLVSSAMVRMSLATGICNWWALHLGRVPALL